MALRQSINTGAAGLEPAAGDLEGHYSIQLSYAPKAKFEKMQVCTTIVP